MGRPEGNIVLDQLEERTNKDDQMVEFTMRLCKLRNQKMVRSNEL